MENLTPAFAETGQKIGYARVSTDDQRLDLQEDAFHAAGITDDHIYEEYVSGAATKRPELQHCLKALRAGDTLVVWRLDRLGRSLKELLAINDELTRRGAKLLSLTEHIDTSTAFGKFTFEIIGAVAEFERNMTIERTRAGLAAAFAKGHRGGRKSKLSEKQVKLAMRMLRDPYTTVQEVADLFHVARATIYRSIKNLKERAEAKKLIGKKRQPKTNCRQTSGKTEGDE